MKTHPHAEATYRVVELINGAFGVEFKTPESYPATVSSFKTEAEAEAWIAQKKQSVIEQSVTRIPFGKSQPKT